MKKKKLWIRILAAVLAFGLLWIVAWMTLSFTGDPISAAMSQRAAKDYIQQSNLRTMGFELSRASYNFKFGEYLVHAVSPHNPDLHFDIICRNGKVDYDTYQYDVLEKWKCHFPIPGGIHGAFADSDGAGGPGQA